MLEKTRLARAKRAYTVRRVPLDMMTTVIHDEETAPQPGDLLLARVERKSLWSRIDAKHLSKEKAQNKPSSERVRRCRWVVDTVFPLTLTVLAAIAVLLPQALSASARVSLFWFAVAVILWSTTSLNAAYIALAAILGLVLTGGSSQERLFDALGADVIWLMIGAFVLGGAVEQSGLAARLTQGIVARARTVSGTFWLLTVMLVPLAFFIPSTSGRAAVVIPVFRSIAAAAGDRYITRALALLMPTVILVATISTLIAAGSHLIANNLLAQIADQRVSYAQWVLWGAPFGLIASALSCAVILRLFLTAARRRRPLKIPPGQRQPLSRAEWKTLIMVAVMVAFWLIENLHGLEIATVTVTGALLLMLPGVGVLKWKDGLKAVSWDLIIFVGAALVLGQALIVSGASQWIIHNLFTLSGLRGTDPPFLSLVMLGFISLTSHIYMTSHTARAAALVPALLYLAQSLGLNPTAVMFISTVGMDYCLTFPVSSKALLMFQALEGETYKPADLLRLSAVLLIVHLLLIVAFYYGYWRWVGLHL